MNERDKHTAGNGDNTEPQGSKPEGEGKTFTQDEVNRIISKRLAEAQAKADAAIAQKEAEIAQREYDHHVKTTMEAKKLPARLLEALKAGDVQTFDQSIAIIEELMDAPFKAAVQAATNDLLKGRTPTVARSAPEPTQGDNIRRAMGLE